MQSFPLEAKQRNSPGTAQKARRRLIHGFDSRNASSRTFNLIRSKLVSLYRERAWRTLGIVSATPDVGKSFISANLAAVMSRDPRFETYLMDLDLRRATIRDIFGIETHEGIVEYLENSDFSRPLCRALRRRARNW